jgi:hypothetical protein
MSQNCDLLKRPGSGSSWRVADGRPRVELDAGSNRCGSRAGVDASTASTLFSLVCEEERKGESGTAEERHHINTKSMRIRVTGRRGSTRTPPILTASHVISTYVNGATRPDGRAVKYDEGNGASLGARLARRPSHRCHRRCDAYTPRARN